jgi:hypothetical protein
MHARPALVDELGAHLYHVANKHRLVEADRTDVSCDEVLAAPADGAGVSGLVDPLHHPAAAHFTLEVDVRRFGQKAQSDFSFPLEYDSVSLALASTQMPGEARK